MPTPVSIHPGVVFWGKSDSGKRPHPRIVVSGIVIGKVLTVNFTDWENFPNSPCIVEKTEHSCLRKKSAIWYNKPLELDAALLGALLAQNRPDIACYPNLSPALLARVVAGLKASGEITEELKEKYGFIPKKSSPPF
jgi:hypothetical protein